VTPAPKRWVLTALLGGAFRFTARRFPPLFGCTLVFALPSLGVGWTLGPAWGFVATWLAVLFETTAATSLVDADLRGEAPSAAAALRLAIGRFPQAFVTSAFIGLAGFLLLIVIGTLSTLLRGESGRTFVGFLTVGATMWILGRYGCALPLVAQGDSGAVRAMQRSAELSKGRGLGVTLAVLALSMLVGAFAAVPGVAGLCLLLPVRALCAAFFPLALHELRRREALARASSVAEIFT
jgi:hypothetical protein